LQLHYVFDIYIFSNLVTKQLYSTIKNICSWKIVTMQIWSRISQNYNLISYEIWEQYNNLVLHYCESKQSLFFKYAFPKYFHININNTNAENDISNTLRDGTHGKTSASGAESMGFKSRADQISHTLPATRHRWNRKVWALAQIRVDGSLTCNTRKGIKRV